MRTRFEGTDRFIAIHPVVLAAVFLAGSGCSGQFSACDAAGTCRKEAPRGTGGTSGSGGSEAGVAGDDGLRGEAGTGGAAETGGGAPEDGAAAPVDSGGADGGVEAPPAPVPEAGATDAGPAGDASAAVGDACAITHLDCNHDPKDGCETDVSSDEHHCGSCERDCLGGVCSAGACAAVAIASGLPYPGELAVDQNYAFFMDGTFSTGRLVRTKLDGSQFTVLVTGLAIPSGLSSDGTRVYFASTGGSATTIMGPGVRSVGGTAGPTQTPVSIATHGTSSLVTSVDSLAVDGERVYWATMDGMVFSAPLAGGTPSAVNTYAVQTDYHVSDLAVDETYVYAAQGPTPWFVPRAGGSPTPIDIQSGNSTAVAMDHEWVYLRYTDPRTEGVAVGRIQKGHSKWQEISTVALDTVEDGALAVDDDTLYYPTRYGIYGIPKSGGNPTLLSSVVSHVAKIVPRVEGGRKVLYWVNQSVFTPPSGNVMRLAL